MKDHKIYINRIKDDLKRVSTPEKAASMRRYFPDGINCTGATSPDIKLIVRNFQSDNSELSALETLSLTESILESAEFTEEVLVAYALINKFVKKNYDDDLLLRFEYWLENYANNWALVDDLCIKSIYLFLLSRPYLIEKTQRWVYSDVSWCRRASNVVWVKFVKRKTGKTIYYLDTRLIFMNCDLLIGDKDMYVQKSVGWLLKATSLQYEDKVVEYIRANHGKMERSTIRYAIEKLSVPDRSRLLDYIDA